MIDATDEERFLEARRELHFLVNEEELRECVFLIALNQKGGKASDAGDGNADPEST